MGAGKPLRRVTRSNPAAWWGLLDFVAWNTACNDKDCRIALSMLSITMNRIELSILIVLSYCLLYAPPVFASAKIGKHDSATVDKFAILYGLFPASDDTLGDDSLLQNIILRKYETYDIGVQSGPTIACDFGLLAPCTSTYTIGSETSYSKNYGTTTSSSINSSLGAEFKLIGAKLDTQYSVGVTVGEEISATNTINITNTVTFPVGTQLTWIIDKKHVDYFGEFDYFIDTFGPGGTYQTKSWKVANQYNTVLRQRIEPLPVPAPLPLLGVGMALKTARRLRKLYRRENPISIS